MINSYKEMTIKQYIEMTGIVGMDLPQFNINMELIKFITGKTTEEVMPLEIPEYKKLLKSIEWTAIRPDSKVSEHFTIDGVKYVTTWRLQDVTAAQFIDLSTFTKDKSLINENLHNIMAVLCREDGTKYDGATFKDRAELFRNKMTMDLVFPLSAFFLKLLQDSLRLIQSSLDQEIKKGMKELEDLIQDS